MDVQITHNSTLTKTPTNRSSSYHHTRMNHQEVAIVEDTPLVLSYDSTNGCGVIELPNVEDGDYDFVVDWGDGTPVQRNIFEHDFEHRLNEYRVTITGTFHGLSFHEKKRSRTADEHWMGLRYQTCTRSRTSFSRVFQTREIHRGTESRRSHRYVLDV